MLVLPPRSSKRAVPALSTSASPTVRQAMRWLGTSSISASRSTDLPSGPAIFQWRVVGAGDGNLLHVGYEGREAGAVVPVAVDLHHRGLDLDLQGGGTRRCSFLLLAGWVGSDLPAASV